MVNIRRIVEAGVQLQVRTGKAFLRCLAMLVLTAVPAAKAAGAGAPAGQPSAVQYLDGRFMGPIRGGRVLTVAGTHGANRHLSFGAVEGGVWRSGDGELCARPTGGAQANCPFGTVG